MHKHAIVVFSVWNQCLRVSQWVVVDIPFDAGIKFSILKPRRFTFFELWKFGVRLDWHDVRVNAAVRVLRVHVLIDPQLRRVSRQLNSRLHLFLLTRLLKL